MLLFSLPNLMFLWRPSIPSGVYRLNSSSYTPNAFKNVSVMPSAPIIKNNKKANKNNSFKIFNIKLLPFVKNGGLSKD